MSVVRHGEFVERELRESRKLRALSVVSEFCQSKKKGLVRIRTPHRVATLGADATMSNSSCDATELRSNRRNYLKHIYLYSSYIHDLILSV